MIRWFHLLTFGSIILVAAACSSKGESTLTKALTGAVKEKKLSTQKMERILQEYDRLRGEDRKVANDYVEVVLSAIEMGGDSSHIDAARKQVLKRVNGKAKV